MKKILIINGHPDLNSYSYALHNAYLNGASKTNAEIRELKLTELDFSPHLAHGYNKRTELEPDLVDAQQKIQWADHVTIIYPVWWGSYPALLKGFLDRTMLPGFAFKKRENSLWWDRNLTGKTGRIISTIDQPAWYYKWFNKEPSTVAMKKHTFDFVGIRKAKTTTIGPIRNSTDEFRTKWLRKVEQLGERLI